MSNDNGLVDEFEQIQQIKLDLEKREESIREKIIELAKQQNSDILFGTNKKCSIKPYQKVIYPEDKSILVDLIKKKGLYEMFSSVNYLKLGPKIIKNEVDIEIIKLVSKETAYRLSLQNI